MCLSLTYCTYTLGASQNQQVMKIKNEWIFQEVNADKTVDQLSSEIFENAMNVVNTARTEKLAKLWV